MIFILFSIHSVCSAPRSFIVHSQGKLSAYAVEEYDTANHFAPLFLSKSVAECQNTRYDATMSTSLRILTTGCRTHHLLCEDKI